MGTATASARFCRLELQAEDGGPPQVEDAGTYEVIGSTVLLSNNIGQHAVLTPRRTHDGFIVDTAHFDYQCRNTQRIARLLVAAAAFHRTHTR